MLRDAATTFSLIALGRDRDGFADLAPAGEVPFVGEAGALFRFDGVDEAGVSLEHDALVVFLFHEREALAVGAEAGVAGDEGVLGHFEKSGDTRDFIVLEPDIAWPFAAGGAALADVADAGLEHGAAVARAAVVFSVDHAPSWR